MAYRTARLAAPGSTLRAAVGRRRARPGLRLLAGRRPGPGLAPSGRGQAAPPSPNGAARRARGHQPPSPDSSRGREIPTGEPAPGKDDEKLVDRDGAGTWALPRRYQRPHSWSQNENRPPVGAGERGGNAPLRVSGIATSRRGGPGRVRSDRDRRCRPGRRDRRPGVLAARRAGRDLRPAPGAAAHVRIRPVRTPARAGDRYLVSVIAGQPAKQCHQVKITEGSSSMKIVRNQPTRVSVTSSEGTPVEARANQRVIASDRIRGGPSKIWRLAAKPAHRAR
ncbi:hypothetical protein SAMN05421748_14453 [Paractinoplanes atraurantiacus]|uniref:Uncharacterized protein n=1 Tax=Paractinoplanes atraurantiacus TaxID=1036182 RepID=A0A285KJU9_9ACTN|nr:hypothetical protein SAMN05421748_14453 [Actinoplanes atraurantiacus]